MDWYPSALISDGSPCPVCVLHAALPGTDKTTRGEELMQLYDIIIRLLLLVVVANMHPLLLLILRQHCIAMTIGQTE